MIPFFDTFLVKSDWLEPYLVIRRGIYNVILYDLWKNDINYHYNQCFFDGTINDHSQNNLVFQNTILFQIDYVDGAQAISSAASAVASAVKSQSAAPRLRSRGHHPQPPLPPSKAKSCVHKHHRTHPAPVGYSSELGSNSEVTLGPQVTTHHHHHHHR